MVGQRAKGVKRSVCVLTSGGFDSNILVARMLTRYDRVYPLYVRCGLIWEEAELYWLKKYLKALKNKKLHPLTVVSMPVSDLDKKSWATTGRGTPGYHSADERVYLPGRNLLLLSKGTLFCAIHQIPTLAIGTLKGNPFPDATPKFFRNFSQLAGKALNFRIRIVTPFAQLKKTDLLKKPQGLPLHLTFSCLSPRGLKPCGRCNKCAEREKVVTRARHAYKILKINEMF